MARRRDVGRPGPGPYLLGLRREESAWGGGFPFDVPAVAQVEQLRPRRAGHAARRRQRDRQVDGRRAIAEAMGFAAAGGELEQSGELPPVPRPVMSGALEPVLTPTKPRNGATSCAERALRRRAVRRRGATFSPDLSIYGDVPLHEQSHGQSFLALAANRFGGEGLYVLDEPEAALSLTGALALLAIVVRAARAGAQFVVATHSPSCSPAPVRASTSSTTKASRRAPTTTSRPSA